MGGQSKILGWVVAGLVVVLALLTVIIVRSSTHPEPPDLTPVEVTPETSAPAETGSPQPNDEGRSEDATNSSEPSTPDELEHSYEPVPNPPREVPDVGDDGDDDGDDGDDDGDDGDDDDGDDDDD